MDVSTRIAIVTGASRGIGKEIAKALVLKHSVYVLLVATNEKLLKEVCKEIHDAGGSGMCEHIAADIGKEEDCEKIVNYCVKLFGEIDYVINNARILEQNLVSELTKDHIQKTFNVNLFGPMMLVQKSLVHVRQRSGKYFFISSGCATKPIKGWSLYCSSKAATLALEEPTLISVALTPGLVRTDMLSTIGDHILEPDLLVRSLQSL